MHGMYIIHFNAICKSDLMSYRSGVLCGSVRGILGNDLVLEIPKSVIRSLENESTRAAVIPVGERAQ